LVSAFCVALTCRGIFNFVLSRSGDVLAHSHHCHGQRADKRDLEMFYRGKSGCCIEGLAGKRRHQFHRLESGVCRRLLAKAHQGRCDAAAHTRGMNEKGADPRWIARRVQHAGGIGGVAPVGAESFS